MMENYRFAIFIFQSCYLQYAPFPESNKLDFQNFIKSQQKFYYAVDYFSRPMSALISSLNDHNKRKVILENKVFCN